MNPAKPRQRQRFRDALPSRRSAITGSLLWGVAMAASALVALWWREWADRADIAFLTGLFAAGGFLAFAPAVMFARLTGPRRPEAAFAATFVALAGATIGMTAFVYAIHFRIYVAHWHSEGWTIHWIVEFAFTMAAGVYQFAVLGLRLYFPVGFLALFAMSAWLAKRPR